MLLQVLVGALVARHAWCSPASNPIQCVVDPVTDGGWEPGGSECAFPFTYNGVTYNECAHIAEAQPFLQTTGGVTAALPTGPNSSDQYWCSTIASYSSTKSSKKKKWGYCNCQQPFPTSSPTKQPTQGDPSDTSATPDVVPCDGSSGFWNTGINYTDIRVDAGDQLYFTFFTGHDVAVVNSEVEFQSCSYTAAQPVSESIEGDPVQELFYSITEAMGDSVLYFVPTDESNCERGMKLKVFVNPVVNASNTVIDVDWVVRNYDEIVVQVGTVVKFTYSSFHDVVRLATSDSHFDNCDFAGSTMLEDGSVGSFDLVIDGSMVGETIPIACSRGSGNHCSSGQRVKIVVQEANPTPTKAPTSPVVIPPTHSPTTGDPPTQSPTTTNAPTRPSAPPSVVTDSPSRSPTRSPSAAPDSDVLFELRVRLWLYDGGADTRALRDRLTRDSIRQSVYTMMKLDPANLLVISHRIYTPSEDQEGGRRLDSAYALVECVATIQPENLEEFKGTLAARKTEDFVVQVGDDMFGMLVVEAAQVPVAPEVVQPESSDTRSEPDDSGHLLIIIYVLSALLGLVILTLLCIRLKKKNKTTEAPKGKHHSSGEVQLQSMEDGRRTTWTCDYCVMVNQQDQPGCSGCGMQRTVSTGESDPNMQNQESFSSQGSPGSLSSVGAMADRADVSRSQSITQRDTGVERETGQLGGNAQTGALGEGAGERVKRERPPPPTTAPPPWVDEFQPRTGEQPVTSTPVTTGGVAGGATAGTVSGANARGNEGVKAGDTGALPPPAIGKPSPTHATPKEPLSKNPFEDEAALAPMFLGFQEDQPPPLPSDPFAGLTQTPQPSHNTHGSDASSSVISVDAGIGNVDMFGGSPTMDATDEMEFIEVDLTPPLITAESPVNNSPLVNHSNTPLANHSNTPLANHNNTPLANHSNTPLANHNNTPLANHNTSERTREPPIQQAPTRHSTNAQPMIDFDVSAAELATVPSTMTFDPLEKPSKVEQLKRSTPEHRRRGSSSSMLSQMSDMFKTKRGKKDSEVVVSGLSMTLPSGDTGGPLTEDDLYSFRTG